jgi:hypothetical protein
MNPVNSASLRRLRWAVRATLVLGVAVSVTANVLHARTEPIAQAIAAWPPLALLITVDLVSRVPVHRRMLGGVRITATFAIAAIAAFISYGHMAAVTSRYGEAGIVPYLLPLSVDGMIIVASISLVELAGSLREPPRPNGDIRSADDIPLAGMPRPVTPVEHLNAPNGSARAPQVTGLPASTDPTPPKEADDHTPWSAATPGTGGTALDATTPETGDEMRDDPFRPFPVPPGLAADLVPLLDAARQARDELQAEGLGISRDALAARLRHNGHAIRTARVAELLATLKVEGTPVNGHRPPNPR